MDLYDFLNIDFEKIKNIIITFTINTIKTIYNFYNQLPLYIKIIIISILLIIILSIFFVTIYHLIYKRDEYLYREYSE